jgi:uncharacterized protein
VSYERFIEGMRWNRKYFLTLFLTISFQLLLAQDIHKKISVEAINLTKVDVQYDPAYYKISYPNGDIPANKGVCTDVVIRAFRRVGIDLQQNVTKT